MYIKCAKNKNRGDVRFDSQKRKKKNGSAAFGHSKYTLKISIYHGSNLYGAIGLLIAFSKKEKKKWFTKF